MVAIHVEHSIDAGHRIVGHKGKCARLHGHTYRFEVDCLGEARDPGFVVDFGNVKDVLNEWDHRMLLWGQDEFFQEFGPGGWAGHKGVIPDIVAAYGLVALTFNPTAENMATHLATRMLKDFSLYSCQVVVWETPKSYARAHVGRALGQPYTSEAL